MPENTQQPKGFESWAIIEIMGHQRLAGYVSERTIAGTPMLQVDVPEAPAGYKWETFPEPVPAFTTFIGGGSIYRLTPCTEEVARAAVAQFRERPIACVDLSRPALPMPTEMPPEPPPAPVDQCPDCGCESPCDLEPF